MHSLSHVNTHAHTHTHTHTHTQVRCTSALCRQTQSHTVTYVLSLSFFPLFQACILTQREHTHTHSARRAGISLFPAATRQCKRYACCTHDCAKRCACCVCVVVCGWVGGRVVACARYTNTCMHADIHECTRRWTGSRRLDCRRPKRPMPWRIGL